MAQLVFRDRKNGSVVLRMLRGELPSHFSEIDPPVFKVKGIQPDTPSEIQLQKGFLSNYQKYVLTYEAPSAHSFRPPFSFSILSGEEIKLLTHAINEHTYFAHWDTQQWIGDIRIALKDKEDRIIWQLDTEIIPPHLPYKKEQAFMFGQLEGWMKGLARSQQKQDTQEVCLQLQWQSSSSDVGEEESQKED